MSGDWQSSLAARHLLPLLRNSNHVSTMILPDWDDTVRLARQARLLGLLAYRLKASDSLWKQVPERVRGHLESAINYSAHRLQMMRMELRALDQALPSAMQVVLLKGAAYILQSLDFSYGRMPNDVDLLVTRVDLDEAEKSLVKAGWESENKSDYDQRYYREWSHELPPMRYPGHALEVDLHHTITPVTSRVRANDFLLFSNLLPLPDSRYLVLHPMDQIIHAAIHLFQDSELDGRLRDLVDLDGLIRNAITDQAGWSELQQRADDHGASHILWLTLHYCKLWLGTPIPEKLELAVPSAWSQWVIDQLMTRACLPRLPDIKISILDRLITQFGVIRYHWLRMPPGLLARHLAHKALHAITDRKST